MREFEKKRKIKKRIFSKVTALILCIIFLGLTHATYNVFLKYQESKNNLSRVKQEVKELEDRYNTLNMAVLALNTQEGLEREIRQKFPVSKEGEQVIVVVPPEQETLQASSTKGFWAQLKYDILSLLKVK